jgi:tetratricopeptide (TPR) repeat protein
MRSCIASYDRAHLDEAIGHAAHAGSLIDGMTDAQLAAHLDAPYYLGWADYLLERFDGALRRVDRAIDVSRAVGHGLFLQPLMQAQLWPYVWRGPLARAEELGDMAVEAALVAGDVVFHATCLYSRGLAATFAGDHDLAVESCERAVDLVRPLDRNAGTGMPGVAFSVALIEADQPERARTELLAGAGGPGLPLMKGAMGLIGYEVLARADVDLGRLDAASGRKLGTPTRAGVAGIVAAGLADL